MIMLVQEDYSKIIPPFTFPGGKFSFSVDLKMFEVVSNISKFAVSYLP